MNIITTMKKRAIFVIKHLAKHIMTYLAITTTEK